MALHQDPHWPRAGTWFTSLLNKEAREIQVDIALLGIGAHASSITPNDAHKTPKAIRKALARYSTWNQTCQIDFADYLNGADFGDVKNPEDQSFTSNEIESALFKANFLIALGGDNSITYSGVMGLAKSVGGIDKIGLITLDAHHDVRDGISNGSPIRQLVEAGLPGEHIVQIGISDFANSKFYANRVREYGIHVIDRASMRTETLQNIASSALAIACENHRAIYLDIDMDVCDRSVTPGCPAATPGGLSADELRQLVALLTADPRVRMADITEIDASMDSQDGRTVRLAALAILEIATSRALLKQ
jgi:formiminoglutamase